MKITIIAVGRARAGPERDLLDTYKKRLPWALDIVEVEEKRPITGAALQDSEGTLLLARVPAGALVVALDERGKALDSPAFADQLGRWRDDGRATVAFLIGGADGHSPVVRERADLLLALGKLTWPHMLVRPMLVEQLYRAWSILHNHPYHRA